MNAKNILAALVAILIFAGCGGNGSESAPHKIDAVAWQADIENEQGSPIFDFQKYSRIWKDVCADDEFGFQLFIAMQADAGDLESARISTRHACPDRLALIEEQQASYRDFERICREGPATREERQLVEAAGC